MSYRIDYQGPKKVRGMEKKTASIPALTGLCVLMVLTAAFALWPRGLETLRGLLIPGEAAVTAGALEEFAGALGAGESVRSAFLGFCRQVMGLGAS